MNEHVQRGFLKEAGIGDFFRGAVGKVKSFFSGGMARHLGDASSSVGAQTIKRAPRAPVATAAAAAPKMQLTRGGTGGSVLPIKPHAPTPVQARNTQIRSEMKRGLREGPTP